MAEIKEDTGQQPVNIESINFDKATVAKLMQNQSFVQAFSALAPRNDDPRRTVLAGLGIKTLSPQTLRGIALALNSSADTSQIEAEIKEW